MWKRTWLSTLNKVKFTLSLWKGVLFIRKQEWRSCQSDDMEISLLIFIENNLSYFYMIGAFKLDGKVPKKKINRSVMYWIIHFRRYGNLQTLKFIFTTFYQHYLRSSTYYKSPSFVVVVVCFQSFHIFSAFFIILSTGILDPILCTCLRF